LFCAFQLTLGEDEVRTFGIVLGRPTIRGRGVLAPPAVCNAVTKIGHSYCNGEGDCDSTGLVQCTNATGGIPIPCPTTQPYCLVNTDGTGKCSEKVAGGCPTIPPTFQCTGVGYYPDPANCRVYYNCYKNATDGSIKPEALYCPSGYVFDPNSASKMYCLYTSVASRCVTVTGCAGATSTKNIAMNYLSNTQFVAMCIPGADPLIWQCATGTKVNLANIPPTCEYICKAPGLFENTLDKYSYWDCIYDSSAKLYSELRTCPINTVFSKTTCVPI
jgi:hypothetical protein